MTSSFKVGPAPFEPMTDGLPALIWVSGPDDHRTFFNKTWLDFTGRSLAEELGAGWSTGVHPDDLAKCLETCTAALHARRAFEIEYRLRRADGGFGWVLEHSVPRFDAAGTFAGFIGACVDIADRKAMEMNVRASETQFRLLADKARDMVYHCRVHPTFRIEYIGPSASEITGRTPEEFVANPDLPFEIIHPDDRPKASDMLLNPATHEDPVVLRWVHGDGRVVYVEHRHTPVYDSEGRLIAIAGIGRDVTERVRAKRLIQSALEKERTHLSRELHDELGQTLTAVKIELSRAVRDLLPTRLDHQTIDRLQSIFGEVEGAIETVRRLATTLRPPALDHLGLVAAIELEAAAFERRTGIRCRVAGNRRVGRLDPEQTTAVFRIVQEALTNVARHANASAVSIRIHGSARRTCVRIQDNGCGISEVQKADPIAIGLLGMRERAELIGATLTITSAARKGTTVFLIAGAATSVTPSA